jgi:hypothetical protein
LARFKECLAADIDHAGQDADSWLAEPGEFMVLYDEKGNRAWMRIERVLRVSLQHDQECSKSATRSLLYKGFRWVLGSARQSLFSEIVFESRAERLIQFLKKLFGVQPVKENYHLRT